MTEAKVVNQVTAESDIELEVKVENHGRETEEVVQVYIKDTDSPLAVRNYSLCGFKRVALQTGESKTVKFTIPNRAMMVVDEQGERHVDSKHFTLFAGVSQPDSRSKGLTGKSSGGGFRNPVNCKRTGKRGRKV